MSLAHYLALGKSIKNVSGPGRYKVAEGPVAPRFGAARPLGAGRRSGPVAVDTLFDHSQPPVAGVEERAEPPAAEASAPAMERPESAVVRAAPLPATASPVSRWFLQTHPARPAETSLPRQGELALGLVQPVRNDLRDSDLEVVPAAPVAAPANPRPSWWARLGQWLRRPWGRRANRRSC